MTRREKKLAELKRVNAMLLEELEEETHNYQKVLAAWRQATPGSDRWLDLDGDRSASISHLASHADILQDSIDEETDLENELSP